VAALGRAEQAGDLGYGRVAGLDVAHGGARGLVPRLGHDQLERDLLVAEVGRCGVAQLVQFQAAAGSGGGVLLEQDPCPVITEARPAGMRADVAWRGEARRDGPAAGQEQRPAGA